MSVAPLLAAAGTTLLLWPRPSWWRRLPDVRRETTARRIDPVWWVALAPLAVGVFVGPAAAVAVTVAAATAIGLRRRASARAAVDRRRDELRRALTIMIGEMSVGAPVVAACRSAADELARAGPSTTAAELARMAARAELGGDPTDTGGGAEVDRLATVWAVSATRGLPMVDLSTMLRADLSARAEHASRLRAGLAGPRATAVILAALPLFGIGMGQLMGAAPVAVLLSPGLGGILLVVGVTLAAAGVWWTDAITAKALR